MNVYLFVDFYIDMFFDSMLNKQGICSDLQRLPHYFLIFIFAAYARDVFQILFSLSKNLTVFFQFCAFFCKCRNDLYCSLLTN